MKALQDLLLTVFTISWTCSAVLLPLLILCPRLQKRVAARSFHALFLLLALRLLIPVRLTLPQPAVTVTAPSYTVTVPAARPATAPASAPAPIQTQNAPAAAPIAPSPAARTERQIPLTAALGVVWLCGIGLCLLWDGGLYLFFRRRLLRGAYAAEPEAAAQTEELARTLGLRRSPALLRAPSAPGPLTVGLLRPVIVLPEQGDTPAALEFILRHELTHLRRRDVAYKGLLSLVRAVHWFNPLVWWMTRTAGRNLELCCDDDVLRGLPPESRRGYGLTLLDAAETRPGPALALSTRFGGGKKQMKARLGNLFARKKSSVALVCVVLGCALLVGGLIACESAGSEGDAEIDPSADPTGNDPYVITGHLDDGRRVLYQEYLEENFDPDCISVVLADLNGDGQSEMIVISLTPNDENYPLLSMRQKAEPADFYGGYVQIYGCVDGAVVPFGWDEYNFSVFNSHAGWGCVELVPLEGGGWAILSFRPWEGQGFADYSYNLYAWTDEGELIVRDSGAVSFRIYGQMAFPGSDDATPEEIAAFVQAVEDYRAKAIPLLDYYEGVGFCYLDVSPEDAFSGTVSMVTTGLTAHVAGDPLRFTYDAEPFPVPATAEEAVQFVENGIIQMDDGFAFGLPNFDGEWNVQIKGNQRLDHISHPADIPDEALYMEVQFLGDATWTPGQVYSFDVAPGYYADLTMYVSVTAPDGSHAERSVTLLSEEYFPPEGPPSGNE